MIDLGYTFDSCMMEAKPVEVKQKSYPSLWIHGLDKELPIDTEDLNKEVCAYVTLIPRSIGKNSGKEGTRCDYSFDVKEIEFENRKSSDDSKRSRVDKMSKEYGGK